MSKRLCRAHALVSVFALLGLALGGCASSTEEDNVEGSSEDLSLGDLLGSSGGFQFGGGGGGVGQVVAGPDGLFSTVVRANGTGCPKGTWTAGISPDGETFTVTFNAFEARVSPGKASDVKDCALDISLLGTQNLTYAIGSFFYQGYAFLENPSMEAVQSANYSFGPASLITSFLPPGEASQIGGLFAGLVEGGVQSKNVLRGPIDQSFLYEDKVGIGKWSPCAPVSNLHINTRIRLKNDPRRRGAGYMNNVTVDGKLSFGWKLSHQTCTPPPATTTTPPSGSDH